MEFRLSGLRPRFTGAYLSTATHKEFRRLRPPPNLYVPFRPQKLARAQSADAGIVSQTLRIANFRGRSSVTLQAARHLVAGAIGRSPRH
jgi:hypothetical protein